MKRQLCIQDHPNGAFWLVFVIYKRRITANHCQLRCSMTSQLLRSCCTIICRQQLFAKSDV